MIDLRKDEKILMVIHRHWIVLVGRFGAGFLLILLPLIIFPAIFSFAPVQSFVNIGHSIPVVLFSLVIYLMLLALFLFIAWSNYFLDIWVITNERIIDVNQRGLFSRDTSEVMLNKIQNITVEIPDFTATMLKFGNIIIETAGEGRFEIMQIPHVNEAKKIMLDYSSNIESVKNNVGA